MKTYEVKERITLTVEPGSKVIISDTQYQMAAKSLELVEIVSAEEIFADVVDVTPDTTIEESVEVTPDEAAEKPVKKKKSTKAGK